MQKVIIGFLMIMVSGFSTGQTSLKKISVLPEPVVCFASDKTEKSFNAVPAELMNRLKSANGASSDIQVTYFQFPDNVKNAFEYAVSVWENLIQSPVPIKMKATWQSLGSKILGSCNSTDYFRNFEGATQMNRYYTIAATEKLMGKELNSGGYDLEATFNKDIKWYFGTNGSTPDSLYDFVSTVMHEIAHGLSFTGFFYTSGARGGYGKSTDKIPSVFDAYVETLDKKKLANTNLFVNPSVEIYGALTSNRLYTGNPMFFSEVDDNRPRLYAPTEFNSGSSIYHLNEDSYPAGNADALMTPAASKGEANHFPGGLTLGLVDDTGWKNMYIRFNKPADIETPGQQIIFEASVKSDYPIDTASLYLIYSFNNFKNSADSLRLLPSVKPTFFSTILKAPSVPGTITYFLKAKDKKKRLYMKPADAPSFVFDLKVGPDTIKPSVSHTPADFIFSNTRNKIIQTIVTDNIGIDTVYVEYFLNDKSKPSFGLVMDSISRYSGALKFSNSELKSGDSVRYRIIVKDSSSNSNKKTVPAIGYFRLKVEGVFSPVVKYYTEFDSPNTDFINKEFSIKTESGFSNGALHSQHPYPSPDMDDTYFNFSTYLRYPIILKQGEMMSFDEVVLVEPGDPGSKYGDYDFWDYAIVEGSKDSGETWLPLIDGYDSGSNSNWKTLYSLYMSGNNSITAGKKEMFVNRKFNMLANGKFSAGDTVIIRFRLFSDPYAHGWGWAIDNLSIQIPVSADDISMVSPGNILVFPNPFSDRISVTVQNDKILKDFSISVFNQFGQMVSLVNEKNVISGYRKDVDMGHLPGGIYLVIVSANGQKIVSQKLIKQN